MKPIEQLQEILCTVGSVEKDVKELRLGCKIIVDYEYDKILHQIGCGGKYIKDGRTKYGRFRNNDGITHLKIDKIIGNPLTLKHLMIYLNNKSKTFQESEMEGVDGEFIKDEYFLSDSGEIIFYDTSAEILHRSGIILDITKDYLHEQTDEVIEKIINFLKG